VMAALEELAEKEILTIDPEGYRFRHEARRTAVLGAANAQELVSLHARVGNVLWGLEKTAPEDCFEAGLHLIRGAEEGRGADVIAGAAGAALSAPGEPARTLARWAHSLEAAL